MKTRSVASAELLVQMPVQQCPLQVCFRQALLAHVAVS